MKNIIYYIATSIDGYITGANEDVSKFAYEGKAVNNYLEDLKSFETVIMGRNTYEFGYKFGVKVGEPVPLYSHMKQYVFSNNLYFDTNHSQIETKKLEIAEIENIKLNSTTDIYLCGGGQFAGWLLKNQKIDVLKIKLNPIVLNQGIKLFENIDSAHSLSLLENKYYDDGVQILTYNIKY